MRERLIELIRSSVDGCAKHWAEVIADHLIANGVIVPPCKVGDTVWYELYGQIESAVVYSCVGNLTGGGLKITDANAKSADGVEVDFNGKCLGKNVFLTREEAEQALKGGEQE